MSMSLIIPIELLNVALNVVMQTRRFYREFLFLNDHAYKSCIKALESDVPIVE